MAKVRSKEEVVDRALCVLAAIRLCTPDASAERVTGWLQRNGLHDKLSPQELALVEAGQPDPSQQIRFSWMNERLHVLCWALGQVPSLAGPTEPRAGEFVAGAFTAEGGLARDLVLAHTLVRSLDELRAAAALIGEQHRRVHDQALKNEPVADVEAGIVQERYAAIQWLLCYEDLDWDDIAGDA